LQVQTEISQRIAEQLKLRLTSSEQQQLVKEAKANPQAYELLLKGRFLRTKSTPADYKKAAEYFTQALAIDPNYALAYAELASAYRYLAAGSFLDPKETMPKAEAAARKALELDEGLADAHAVLANIRRDAWDWAGAEQEFKRAIELNPGLARAHSGYGGYLSIMLRHEQAIAEMKRARELDPLALGQNSNLGYAYYWARQYDQAIEQLKKTLELDQNFSQAHLLLAYAYAAKGDYTQAIAKYREAIRLGRENTSDQCYLGAALAKAGQRAEAEAILKQLETTKEYLSPAELAALYVGLGDKEKALAALERAYAAHDLQLQFLSVEPHYDSLRAEPRFQELIRKVGLTQN
jgi:Tfp pilus assembly protein PilF